MYFYWILTMLYCSLSPTVWGENFSLLVSTCILYNLLNFRQRHHLLDRVSETTWHWRNTGNLKIRKHFPRTTWWCDIGWPYTFPWKGTRSYTSPYIYSFSKCLAYDRRHSWQPWLPSRWWLSGHIYQVIDTSPWLLNYRDNVDSVWQWIPLWLT